METKCDIKTQFVCFSIETQKINYTNSKGKDVFVIFTLKRKVLKIIMKSVKFEANSAPSFFVKNFF